jgi:putative membrane protein
VRYPENDDEARDIDARFLLANERTLLAWIRTSLAFLVSGFAVQQFATDLQARQLVAVTLMAVALVSAVIGAWRYADADRALREGRLPHDGRLPMLLAIALAVVSAAAILAVLVGAAG